MKNRTKKINWGIVGFGQIARDRVAPALAMLDDARLVAICDPLPEAREKGVAQDDCIGYERLDDMLADLKVDVIYIASPNALHCEQTIAAAQNGKHVFCEKPMALNVEQCQRMVDACNSAAVKLGIGCMGRFNAYNVEAKRLVANGELGQIRHVRGWFSFVNEARDNWRYDASISGGGPVMDLGIHLINLLRFILDVPVIEIWATGEYRGYQVEQTSAALLKLANGITSELGCSYETELRASLEIFGEQGSLSLESTLFQNEEGVLQLTKQGKPDVVRVRRVNPYSAELTEMINSIRNGSGISTDGQIGLQDIAIAQAWLASIRNGQKIHITGL
jgi:predicted dehydrogenase